MSKEEEKGKDVFPVVKH